jgi:DNA primase
MDKNAKLRSIPLLTVFAWLGVDVSQFKHRKGKNGPEHYGKCIYHESKTNNTSFSFTADLAHCFSCNLSFRGAIDAVKEFRHCNFTDAVAFLEANAGREVQTPASAPIASPEPNSDVLRPLEKDTWKKFQVPCEWLGKRIPDAAIRERYGVFCYNNPARKSAYSGRVMLPVKCIRGILYGYLGRCTANSGDQTEAESKPKYLFPKNLPKSRFLFGAHELAQHQQTPGQAGTGSGDRRLKVVYLVESPFCVMKFASMGLPAVASYGWSVSTEQVALLGQICKGVIYLPDVNKRNESHACLQALAASLWVRFPNMPEGIDDPEQMTAEQIHGL